MYFLFITNFCILADHEPVILFGMQELIFDDIHNITFNNWHYIGAKKNKISQQLKIQTKIFCTLSLAKNEIYEEMKHKTLFERSYYSACLTPLQKKFVKSATTGSDNVKDLIRMVKHWRKTEFTVIDYFTVASISLAYY